MSDVVHPALLIVDDEELVRELLRRILAQGGYKHVMTASSIAEARRLMETETVDLILTDMQMPGGSGLELLTYVHETWPHVATLMITGVDDKALAEKALALGAYGYLIKPFRHNEVLIGVSNAFRRRTLELENQYHRENLEEKVKDRTIDLWKAVNQLEQAEKATRASRTETIERLAIAAEFHDEETGRHVVRMSRYCEVLARAACPDDELCDSIREAGSLHDVGKIGIPDHVLLKPKALSPDERALMQKHAAIGHCILSGSESPLLKLAAEIALTHHEKVDGTGYPKGLVGEAIPLAGRIAAIADVFDALTSDRVYRRAYPLMEAIDIMKKETGRHFDKDLLAVFWRVLPEVLAIKEKRGPGEIAS